MATIQEVWRRKGTAVSVLNREIKAEILRQKAIDTGRMRNISKVLSIQWNEANDAISVEIDSTEYYKYVDTGYSRKWHNRAIPRNITQAFLKRKKVEEQLEKLVEIIFEYRIDQQFV